MNPKETPSPEEIAATDELFQDQPIVPVPEPGDTSIPSIPPRPEPVEESPATPPAEGTEHASPLEDHARELQLEFEEQEEEGKV